MITYKILNKQDIQILKRSLSYIAPYKIKFATLFLYTGILIALGIMQPMIIGDIIQCITYKSSSGLYINILLLILVYILQSVFSYIKNYTSVELNNNLVCKLKCDMYQDILNLQVKTFDEMQEGEFISRLHGDVQVLSMIITDQFINTILDVIKAIVLCIVVFRINIILGIIVLVSFPFFYFIFSSFGRILRIKNSDLKKDIDSSFSIVQQSLFGIKQIKGYGLKAYCNKNYKNIMDKVNKKTIKISLLNNLSFTLSDLVTTIDNILVILIGSYFVLNNELSIKYFIAFISYSSQFTFSLQNITRLNSNLQQMIVSLERIFNLRDNFLYAHESYGNKRIEKITGKIQYENVSFSYDNKTKILDDINMIIEPQKLTALVGKNGSGKSTIFSLLVKYYDCDTGTIKIDNINLKEFDEYSLRNNISLINHEPFFFELSIKENLKLVSPEASDNDIFDACMQSCIHEYIMNLPQKYDTVIEENGSNFSSGQKQRIALARCFLKKTPIVLLDEATSALDSESQWLIRKAIDNLLEISTVIMITHDMNLIQNASKIIVLEDGRIVGQGNHNFLLHNCNLYSNLYKHKFEDLSELSS